MATWQYSMYLIPAEYVKANQGQLDKNFIDYFPGWQGLTVENLSPKLEAVFGSEQAHYSGVAFGKSENSCVQIHCIENSRSVEEISARLDLRAPVSTEVNAIFDLAHSINGLIITEDFRLINPGDFEALKDALKTSVAFRFISNPIDYLKSLDSQ